VSWLARALGFTSINAIGVDLAETQVRRARTRSRDLSELEGIELTFETGDICERLPWPDASFDLCLCLYGVLNHIPPSRVSGLLAEIARVTRHDLIATVRSIGSTPTICVDSIEEARWFWHDECRNRLEAELQNGGRLSMDFRLFGTAELKAASNPYFEVTELQGLDLFHGRFTRDRRWNRTSKTSASFIRKLESLEERYCRDPEFVDHANHLLFVASPRPSPRAEADR
jgi:SAM-dependent methyltransferase